ncbi:MAG: hypothetical protein KDG55_21995 [Rhodocyclaceae bacterium]|nr:hypothetical protein [Rhodocyclaceae bacterium]
MAGTGGIVRWLLRLATASLLVSCGGGGSTTSDGAVPTPEENTGGGTTTPPTTPPGDSSSPPTTGGPVDASGLPAFPGAEGFGAGASGGRGGRVITVTSLATSGPGSLQAALDERGARTIVFAVSGLIDGPVVLTHGDVTVAGQTSPGGITVRGFVIQGDVVCEDDSPACVPSEAPSNFIVRFIRSRDPSEAVDPSALAGGDTFRLHRARNGILDHVSAGNAYDEAFQVSLSSDITIQYSLLAETLGEHSDLGGMLINYSDPTRGYPLTRLTLHHNLWNRISGRLPEFSRENFPSARGSVMDIEMAYNLIWDPSFPIWLGLSCDPSGPDPLACPADYRMNLVGNLFMARAPRFNHGMMTLEGALAPSEGYLPPSRATRLFLQGNGVNLFPDAHDLQLIYCCNDYGEALANGGLPYPDASSLPPFVVASRHDFPVVTATSGETLADHLAAQAGAFPRDPMDTRLMAAVLSRTFSTAAVNSNPAGDALAIVAGASAAPADGDGDGLPDSWEQAHGLDPQSDSSAGTDLGNDATNGIIGCSAGYTNLECYLNETAAARLGGR